MDKVAAFGIPALWSLGIQTREETQREIVENLPLVKTLIELEKDHKSNLVQHLVLWLAPMRILLLFYQSRITSYHKNSI